MDSERRQEIIRAIERSDIDDQHLFALLRREFGYTAFSDEALALVGEALGLGQSQPHAPSKPTPTDYVVTSAAIAVAAQASPRHKERPRAALAGDTDRAQAKPRASASSNYRRWTSSFFGSTRLRVL